MSYVENVEINISESFKVGALANNLMLLSVGTATTVTAYTKNSDLTSVPAMFKDTLTAIFAESSGVSTVYTYTIAGTALTNLKDVMAEHGIWAVVLMNATAVTASENIASSLTRGMVLSTLTGTTYTKPTTTNTRLAYFRNASFIPTAVVASRALANLPFRTWANRLMDYSFNTYTASELTTLRTDLVNAFYIEGLNKSSGSSYTSTGAFIDNEFAKDYISSNLRNAMKIVLFADPKPPYDYRGNALVEAKLMQTLQQMGREGLLQSIGDDTYNYSIDIPIVSEQTADAKAKRYFDVTVETVLAGSLEGLKIVFKILSV